MFCKEYQAFRISSPSTRHSKYLGRKSPSKLPLVPDGNMAVCSLNYYPRRILQYLQLLVLQKSGINILTPELAIWRRGVKVSFILRTKVRQDLPVLGVYLRMVKCFAPSQARSLWHAGLHGGRQDKVFVLLIHDMCWFVCSMSISCI